MRVPRKARKPADALLEFALSLPDAIEDHPWGERVAKVNRKVFVFFGKGEEGSALMSVKLPVSGAGVLALPFAEPTGYGLGKSGWVTIHPAPEDSPPLELLREWIEESYRAIAPKRLVAELDARE